jgi:hypothetical protein
MYVMKGAGYSRETTVKMRSLAALVAAGLIFAPAAWAAGDQTQTPPSQRHVRHAYPAQAQPKPVPQNSCDYDRAAGNCMIDLGYGRCVSCDSRGPTR